MVQAIDGVDPDEDLSNETYIAKLGKAHREHINEVRDEVERDIATTVDFAHYSLSSDSFAALVPALEVNFFPGMETLILKGN